MSVFISHGVWSIKCPRDPLLFMYKPFVYTVCTMYKDAQLVLAHELRTTPIPDNSTLVFIGVVGMGLVPWALLKSRGVKLVYYSTEHANYFMNTLNQSNTFISMVDEVWDFSPTNLSLYSKALQMTRRFVPIAFHKNRPLIQYDTVEIPKLVFVGGVQYGTRSVHYKKLKQELGDNLLTFNNIWTEQDFDSILLTRPFIFLNFHKHEPTTYEGCNHFAEMARMYYLLSSKALIISSHCGPLDESLCTGMITFCKLQEVASEFNTLLQMTPQERETLATDRLNRFKDNPALRYSNSSRTN